MNYLAHLHLAAPHPLARAGALLGDFMHGVDAAALSPPLARALAKHRAIDAFTDRDESTRALRPLVPAPLAKAAPLLLDVWFDHLLTRHFERFHPAPLERFLDEVQAALAAPPEPLPGRLAAIAPRIAGERWLHAYRTPAGIAAVLSRMSGRMRRPLPLSDAVPAFLASDAVVEAAFLEFYPRLAAFAATLPDGADR